MFANKKKVNPTRLPQAPLYYLDKVVQYLHQFEDEGDYPTIKHLQNTQTRKLFEEIAVRLDPIDIRHRFVIVKSVCVYPIFTLLMGDGQLYDIKLQPESPIQGEIVTPDEEAPPPFSEDSFPPCYVITQ